MTVHTVPEIYDTEHVYNHILVKASQKNVMRRCALGIPTTGVIRFEWALARYGAVIPCNWSAGEIRAPFTQLSTIDYGVADARNVIVQLALDQGYEWLFFVDHDVLIPADIFIKLNEYMRDGTIPIVAGLYFTRSHPSEPLIYRDRGNSYYAKWKIGEKVWCNGTGMGCTLINMKVLQAMWKDAEEYVAGGNMKVRRVFDTPQFMRVDSETGFLSSFQGTEDLAWYDRVFEGDYLAKAGFKQIAKKKWPILVDASIVCLHMDINGTAYPLGPMDRWQW